MGIGTKGHKRGNEELDRLAQGTLETPLGRLRIRTLPEGLVGIDWLEGPNALAGEEMDSSPFDPLAQHWLKTTREQLQAYFSGLRSSFDLPYVLRGTEFQLSVWHALLNIPYGETRSYRDIAQQIGRGRAVRAVGQANRVNPIPIIVPCHRVIGAGGQLVGYAGSQVHLKSALLTLEQANLPALQITPVE